ncbi:MAG: hypothetical protein BroJett026_35860 [Betaproteobacteria bacterium]|nr:MAG: hypothetical protein BroJett026_35860 [Betaproteobacteria bacterium]
MSTSLPRNARKHSSSSARACAPLGRSAGRSWSSESVMEERDGSDGIVEVSRPAKAGRPGAGAAGAAARRRHDRPIRETRGAGLPYALVPAGVPAGGIARIP